MDVKEEFSKLSSLRKCPLCGQDLESGYVSPGRGIFWDTKKHTLVVGDEKLGPHTIRTQNVPALRCVKCKIAILDYERG